MVVALLALLPAMYLVVEALRVPLLTDTSWLIDAPPRAAFGLLAVDVVLPVPSSVVMIANGALLGVVAGAFVSLARATAASPIAFALGRRAGSRMERLVPVEERRRAVLADRTPATAAPGQPPPERQASGTTAPAG